MGSPLRHARRARSVLTFAVALGALAPSAGCHRGPAIPIDAVSVRLLGEGRDWRAEYLIPGAGGVTAVKLAHEIHVPLGARVDLSLSSADYICQFALPAWGLRDFASPGLPGDFHFRADRAGSYDLRGDELCGIPHGDEARGHLVVEDPARYRHWVAQQEENTR